MVISPRFPGLRRVLPSGGVRLSDPVDPLLDPLLAAPSDEDRRVAIEHLLTAVAMPVVEKVLSSRMRQFAAGARASREDLRSEVVVRLLSRLTRITASPAAPIASFRDYVAVTTCHVLDDFLRGAFPFRASVRNRVRYLLSHDARFALWEEKNGTLIGGRRQWRGRAAATAPDFAGAEAIQPVSDTRVDVLRAAVDRVFTLSGEPMALSAIVGLLVDSRADRDASAELATLRNRDPDPVERIRNVEYVRRLWKEILLLPPGQRLALLLNLRDSDGESVARLFPVVGVAGLKEIAGALDMDLATFSAMWTDLPIEDNRIAALLDVTRQQVINLRKAARARLVRRLSR